MAQYEAVKASNAEYVKAFGEKGSLPMPPARKAAFVVCMDARINPAAAFGLKEGDVHVIRNAGGRAAEAVRSLAISQQLLGTREIYVVHHTDCGMLTFKDSDLAKIIKESLGVDVGDRAFLPFSDVDQSVRDDVELLSKEPLILPGTPIIGLTYDVKTGAINEIAKATR